MTNTRVFLVGLTIASATLVLAAQATPPPQQTQPDVFTKLSGPPGLPPRIAVPDFLALSGDAETTAAAKTIGQVLFDDLKYEQEFWLIARDTYRSIPQPPSIDRVEVNRWKELGADGVIVGSIMKNGNSVIVQVRLMDVNTGRSAFAKQYSGSIANPRLFAHTIADEIHEQQRALQGVARTRILFSSDRDGDRLKTTVANRDVQEIYVADYDGVNERRLTTNRSLNIAPVWLPGGGGAYAYQSYRNGYSDIFIASPSGIAENPAKGGPNVNNYLPAWSPDGGKLAFFSARDGNPDIYVVNRNGSGLTRLTHNAANESTPTWSPSGNQIAFTSDRSGTPQVYVMNADGSGETRITSESWCDRPTWSPEPFNEIAFSSRTGGGFDIKIFEFASRAVRQITNGPGSNESPAFAPNGRHLAFMSSRAGKYQVYTISRKGDDVRQVTHAGNNKFPNWGR